ncbi:TPA: hypothetical protein DDW35_03475 [Candidatus Sumerlaeota bacterium]|jgi:hypothetical protein|nr:hypothetical protein [Candidatus Sumerlaeota bacterium]
MEKVLQTLNSLVEDGVLGQYAIGGAMAAMFYAEPVMTFDLDVFVVLPHQGLLITLTPLYDALQKRGYEAQGECVNIEGVPVQFLPAYNPLLEEALKEAEEKLYQEQIPTWVLRVEHLIAICLQTGREKDKDRVRHFCNEAQINMEYLQGILKQHGLEEKWLLWKI